MMDRHALNKYNYTLLSLYWHLILSLPSVKATNQSAKCYVSRSFNPFVVPVSLCMLYEQLSLIQQSMCFPLVSKWWVNVISEGFPAVFSVVECQTAARCFFINCNMYYCAWTLCQALMCCRSYWAPWCGCIASHKKQESIQSSEVWQSQLSWCNSLVQSLTLKEPWDVDMLFTGIVAAHRVRLWHYHYKY